MDQEQDQEQEQEQQKKKLLTQTIITSIVVLVFVSLFILGMAALRLGCDKYETKCNVTKSKNAWCGIQYDTTDYYTYRCPYTGPECSSANTTIKCYQMEFCPQVECINEAAFFYAIFFGIISGASLIGGIIIHGIQWYNYHKKYRMYSLLNDNRDLRDTIAVSGA